MLAVHSTILHLLPDDLPWPWVEVVWFNPAVAGSFVSVLHFSFVRGFLGSRSNEIMQIVCSAFQRNTLGSILKSLLFILHPLTLISYLTLSISCLPIFKCGDLCKLQNWPSFNFWPAVQTIWKNFEGVSFHWILGANLYICVWLSFAIFMLMEKWVERLGEGWIAGLFIVTTAGEGGIHKSPGGRRVTFLQTGLLLFAQLPDQVKLLKWRNFSQTRVSFARDPSFLWIRWLSLWCVPELGWTKYPPMLMWIHLI